MLTGAPARALPQDQPLLLAVEINGHAIGKIGEFVLRDGTLLARRTEWHDLGFRVGSDRPDASDGLVPADAVGHLAWQVDQPSQTLRVTATTESLLPAVLQVGTTDPSAATARSGIGATLDYDVSTSRAVDQSVATGLFDLRVFSPWGVASTGLLANAGIGGLHSVSESPAIRLESSYTISDPVTLRQIVVGDFVTDDPTATRPVRLAGVQVSSNFSLRPDLVTFPLPTVNGTAAVPSTLDVLINGSRMLSQQVDAGPFELPRLPVVTGAGTISMTLTNALGHQVVVSLPFYASSSLLSPGLQTYAAQVGFLRQHFGIASNDYGPLVGSGSYRRGLSQSITAEFGAQGGDGIATALGGVTVNIADFALLDMTAAASNGRRMPHARRAPATAFSAALQRTGRLFSASASISTTQAGFRDIASIGGEDNPTLQINASAGVSLGHYGSLNLAYTAVDRAKSYIIEDEGLRIYGQPGKPVEAPRHAHLLSASFSAELYSVSFFATGFRDFAAGGSTGFILGLSLPLGERSSASTNFGAGSGSKSVQVQAQQSPVTIGDWGYQAAASATARNREFGQVQYKSPWGLWTAGADHSAGQTTLRAEAAGAVAVLDGGVFASNPIEDSFAVVDTGGMAGVPVLRENRLVGSTNSAGRLLVPDLRAFDANRLAIDPLQVPQDATIDVTERVVRPPLRSGVVVTFPVRMSYAALLALVDRGGTPIVLGSNAALQSTGSLFPIGFDGAAYIEGLSAHNVLLVTQPDGHQCRAKFDYHPITGEIPKIGPVPCRALRQ